MAKCYTDCIVRPLRICFEMIGHFIGCHPWWFFIAPLVLPAGLGSGFYFLKDRMSNDIEGQFTPIHGQAKMERQYIQETFPEDDSMMFSSLRLSTDGTHASFIATNDRDILTVESLQEIIDLDLKVRSVVAQLENETVGYVDVCATVTGSCFSSDILRVINYNASHIDSVNLTFPWHYSDFERIPLHISLGSVTLDNNSVIQSAKAIQIRYYLREGSNIKTDIWLQAVMNLISNESTSSIEVSYSTSMSLQWEFEKSPASIVKLFSITYATAITFSIISCWRLDNVRSKVWVASVGVLSAGLAVLTSFGVLLLLDQPFVMTVASSPFMILGIGIDDMFIMLSCWQRTHVLDSVADRLAETYREAAVSISITSLTDALALFLGYRSPFGSVRSFCLYAGVSVTVCYVYNITFLGAFVALNGRREAENRHWLTCAKIPEDLPPGRSKAFGLCCVGGTYDRTTEKEENPLLSRFFEKVYGPFLTKKWVKVCVLVVYAGYLAVSIYGCSVMKEGLDVRNLVLDDSYIIKYYNDQSQHFSEYSYNAMVAVKQPLSYWTMSGRQSLWSCIVDFENLNYVNGTFAWFHSFQRYANATDLNISSEQAFKNHLPRFLELNPMFRQDINLSAENDIQASRFFIQTLHKTTMKDMLVGLRETARQCPIELLVYHPAFIYFDQYTIIVDNTIQTILVAAIVMLCVSLILIPNPLCSLWVAFAMSSVIVGVAGFMALWNVSLDSISMINLVMCIGFSVDFSAHISYAFVCSSKSNVNERSTEAMAHLGYPIVQGAVSTILGVVALSVSGSYIFRTFFKIMFLVILFGVFHGLVFIPVFLTLFGACGNG